MKILYHSWVEHNSYILKGLECPFCKDGSEIVDENLIPEDVVFEVTD